MDFDKRLVIETNNEPWQASPSSTVWRKPWSPHMSQHHPFVEEETVIWVKTGHLSVGL